MFRKTVSKLPFRIGFKRRILSRRMMKAAKRASETTAAKEPDSVTVRGCHNDQSHLYLLPTELLLEIAGYLPLPSAMALGVTCTRFYKAIASPILKNNPSKITSFNMLAQMEISLGPWNSKPLCGECFISHADDSFWGDQLEIGPVQRRCKSTQKLLWLHPESVISFNELKLISSHLRELSMSYLSAEPEVGTIQYVNFNKKDSILLDHSIDLLRFPYSNRPTLRTVFEYLEKFNVPICPHITTGEPMVADIYRKAILQCAPDSISVQHYSCPVRNCQTFIKFRVERHRVGALAGEKLVLHLRRCINVWKDPERQGWVSQAIITPDKQRFQRSWRASWRWKILNDEIDKRKFIVNVAPNLTSDEVAMFRREMAQLTASRDGWNPEDIRELYTPLVPHPHMAAFIGTKNDVAIQARDEFDNLF